MVLSGMEYSAGSAAEREPVIMVRTKASRRREVIPGEKQMRRRLTSVSAARLLQRLEEGLDVLEFLWLEDQAHRRHGGNAELLIAVREALVWFEEGFFDIGG